MSERVIGTRNYILMLLVATVVLMTPNITYEPQFTKEGISSTVTTRILKDGQGFGYGIPAMDTKLYIEFNITGRVDFILTLDDYYYITHKHKTNDSSSCGAGHSSRIHMPQTTGWSCFNITGLDYDSIIHFQFTPLKGYKYCIVDLRFNFGGPLNVSSDN